MDVLRKGCAVCPSFRFLRYQTGGFSEEVCNKSQRGYRAFLSICVIIKTSIILTITSFTSTIYNGLVFTYQPLKYRGFITLSYFDTAIFTVFAGCPNEEELGVKVPSSKRIPDKYMTSSSHQSNGHQAFRGRIGLESKGSWADGWCASQSDSDPYIQIFFGMYFDVSQKN